MTGAEKAGLVILTIEGTFAIWSAVNPSRWTMRKFAAREGTWEDYQDLRDGYAISSVLVAGFVAGVALVAKERPTRAVGYGASAGILAWLVATHSLEAAFDEQRAPIAASAPLARLEIT